MISNQKQIVYNQVRGVISEINFDPDYCSITLEVGHSNKRNITILDNEIRNMKGKKII